MADNTISADYVIQVNFKDSGRPTQWPLVAGSAGKITQIDTYWFKTFPLSVATVAAGAQSGTWTPIAIENTDKLVFLGLSIPTPAADGSSTVAYSIYPNLAGAPAVNKPAPAAPAAPPTVVNPGDLGAAATAAGALLLPAQGDAYVGSSVHWLATALHGNSLFAMNLTGSLINLEVFAGFSK